MIVIFMLSAAHNWISDCGTGLMSLPLPPAHSPWRRRVFVSSHRGLWLWELSVLAGQHFAVLAFMGCIVSTGELGPGRKVVMVLPSKRKAHVCFYHLWKDARGLHLELLLG